MPDPPDSAPDIEEKADDNCHEYDIHVVHHMLKRCKNHRKHTNSAA
jgi:hypothetical protein